MLATSSRTLIDLYVFTLASFRVGPLNIRPVVAHSVAVCIGLSLILANVAIVCDAHLSDFFIYGVIVFR